MEWAAAQPWSTGNVGMVGNSYSGSIQYAVAAEHPPHLKALSAGGSNTSRYRDWLMIGGMFHQGNTGTWGLTSTRARTGIEDASRSGETANARRLSPSRSRWTGIGSCASIRCRTSGGR